LKARNGLRKGGTPKSRRRANKAAKEFAVRRTELTPRKFEAWKAMVKQLEEARARARQAAIDRRIEAEYNAPTLSKAARADLERRKIAKRKWWNRNKERILADRRKKAQVTHERSKMPYPRPKKAKDYGIRQGTYRSETTGPVEPHVYTFGSERIN
jgi:hypothetical protein